MKILAVLFLFASLPLGASPWSAELGLPLAAPGSWAPLRLTAPEGPWSVTVVSVSVSGRESPPVVFRHAAAGDYEDPLFLADSTRSLKLAFASQAGGREEMVLPLSGRLFPGHLIGVWGVSPAVQGRLSEVLLPQEPVRVFSLAPQDWPVSPLSYGGISALVTADPGALSPAQLRSVRAWIASGGRLAVFEPALVLGQIGPVRGLGTAVAVRPDASWRDVLALKPYGDAARLGTMFEPAARAPARGRADSPAALAFALGWGAFAALVLVLRKTPRLGAAMTVSALGTLALGALWLSGLLAWDQGLPVHTREIGVPGAGRWVSLEATITDGRSGPFNWPAVSPWAVGAWTAAHAEGLRWNGSQISVQSFEPERERAPQFRLKQARWARWNGGWEALEDAPAVLLPDLPWLTKVASHYPDTVWLAGFEGGTCWISPEEAL